MKKIIIIFLIVTTLLLDYAALDDITTGNEPNNTGEFLILLFSLPLLYFLIKEVRKKATNETKNN